MAPYPSRVGERGIRVGDLLALMVKEPRPGHVKTRLGLADADRLYEAFLRDLVGRFGPQRPWSLALAFTPPEARDWFQGLWPHLLAQPPGDLGERLAAVCAASFAAGYSRVVLLASDSPDLPTTHVDAAFAALALGDVALGPCEDGGYYLIGLRRPTGPAAGDAYHVFRRIDWSTPAVTQQTLARAEEAGLRVRLLPAWYDVDDRPSLARLAAAPDLARLLPHTARHLAGAAVPEPRP